MFHSFLSAGMQVPVHLKNDEGKYVFENEATLLRLANTAINPEPEPFYDKCPVCRKQMNVVKEKWIVEFTDPFLKGREFTRNILKFHSLGGLRINTLYENDFAEFIRPFCSEVLEDDDLCLELKKQLSNQRPKNDLYETFMLYIKEL